MIVVTFLLVVDLTPILILLPLARPILTFAKGLVVSIVCFLQWTRRVDIPVTVDLSRRILLAGLDCITEWSNAIAEKAMHFSNLTMRNTDGVLHDTPMVRLLAVVVSKPRSAVVMSREMEDK